jgi:hypothetical protein
MTTSTIIEDSAASLEQADVARLERNVQRRVSGRVRGFRLLALADGLILQGNASTYHAKQLAQHAIMEATQLPILANEIEVDSCCATPAFLIDC